MQNNICCACLQQKPAMFFPLTGGVPGQPSFREKLLSFTSKIDYLQIVNAVICHKCSYFLDQAYKFKSDCEKAENRFFSYVNKISAIQKRVHCFSDIEQAAGLNLVLHKIEDTVNNYSLILGVEDRENGYVIPCDDSDSSCFILSDEESDYIVISDTERSTSPLLEPVMPSLSPQNTPRGTSEYQCKQCTMTFFTRQNLKRHKRVHDQALDTINSNIKHHMITDEDIRSIIGIRAGQRPTITYTYLIENPLQDHTYYTSNLQADDNSAPPTLSPQTDLRNRKHMGKVPLFADIVGASAYKCNLKPKQNHKLTNKRRKRRVVNSLTLLSVSSNWKYNPKVVLTKDELLDQRILDEASNYKERSQIVNIIPKCVHNFLDDSCRTKTTLLYANITKTVC